MNQLTIVLTIVAIAAIGVTVWMYLQKTRTQRLQSRFGPEYDRAVHENRDRAKAEAALERRAQRVAKFHIRPLKEEERERYVEAWRREQAQFVDNPRSAVAHADTLVQEVMRARGYPVGEFEQNAADLSVDHPRVVEHYRIAHEVALRDAKAQTSTEDLRNAMISYRVLFEDLLEKSVLEHQEVIR